MDGAEEVLSRGIPAISMSSFVKVIGYAGRSNKQVIDKLRSL